MEFPTIAERAVADWQSRTCTTPFESIARTHGGDKLVTHDWNGKVIEWCFDDDSRVTITGKGRSYKIEAHLP